MRTITLCILLSLSFYQTVQAQATHYIYTTQGKESLAELAWKFLKEPNDVATLQANNPALRTAAATGKLAAGQIVKVPVGGMLLTPASAKVSHVSGEVNVKLGDFITQGQTVKTSEGGAAVVSFPDGSKTQVNPNSSLTITQLQQISRTDIYWIALKLDTGRIEAEVNPARPVQAQFDVNSRRTVTGVRGTVFAVSDNAGNPADANNNDNATLEVLRGKVAFSGVNVEKDYGSFLKAKETKAAAPVPLLPASAVNAAKNNFVWADATGISFSPVAGAVGYQIALAPAGSQNPTRWIDTTTPRADLPAGSYEINVRAKDANGLLGLEAKTLLSLVNPVKSASANKALREPLAPKTKDGNAFEFTPNTMVWPTVALASLYHVQVKDMAGNVILDVRTPFQNLKPNLPAGEFQGRIASILMRSAANNTMTEDEGDFGDWQSFTMTPRP